MGEQAQPTRRDTDLALTTHRIGRPLWHYASVPSTMPLAHELARAGATDGTAILADEQTAGRGRRGRAWIAPPGTAILCSVICRPPVSAERLFLLVAAFGLGLCAGIEHVTGLRPSVKWPNDLLLDGRKLAGILCESRLGARGLDHAVVGFGLNVNLLAEELPAPQPGALSPTSLALALGAPVERDTILRAILGGIDDLYDRLWAGDEARVSEGWVARLAGLGEEVRIETDAGARSGRFVGVAADGALVLDAGGQLEQYLVGDVILGPRPMASNQNERQDLTPH
jgi:BirA family biotin operon repressor/biotin-[acetyl-CoA-carboxylase] ligase